MSEDLEDWSQGWTYDSMVAAQEKWVASGKYHGDARAPKQQTFALREIEFFYRKLFESGDVSALARAIGLCAQHDLRMPAWVAIAFQEGRNSVHFVEVDSWDDVLGPVVKKGQHRAALRRARRISWRVGHEIDCRKRAGESIDKEMFIAVGEQLGIGATLASEYYSERRDFQDAYDAALDRSLEVWQPGPRKADAG